PQRRANPTVWRCREPIIRGKTVTYLSGSNCYPSIGWTDGRIAGAYSATLEIGETVHDGVFLPRHYTGRNARQGNERRR
ncbi:hypothetical protein NP945_25180, partial [Mesorhizobium sp. LMG17149]|uniref:hypothetical protein n=1 Tax=Mesorhizobium sp. LMG17149 TaxID=2968497 RepID=UPI002119AB9B